MTTPGAPALQLKVGRPPNYDELVARIGRPPANAIFTWGDVVYVPRAPHGMQLQLDELLLEHEQTHSRQQAIIGGPEAWWRWYIDDVPFRRQQELAAYRNQYHRACREGLSRQLRRQLCRELANDLSGALYGHIFKRADALIAIQGGGG